MGSPVLEMTAVTCLWASPAILGSDLQYRVHSDTEGCCSQHKKVYSYSEEDTRLIVMTQFKASSVIQKNKMNVLVHLWLKRKPVFLKDNFIFSLKNFRNFKRLNPGS